MPTRQSPDRRFTILTLAVAFTAAVGCGPIAKPETTPENLEQIRAEMKATSQRELSGNK